jgi:peptide/nickel transport system substrate-binding protein
VVKDSTTSQESGLLGKQISRRTVLKAAGLGASAAALAGVPVAAASRRQVPAGARIADQAKGEVIRLGALEGGLTDGFMPWKQFGQEFVWNWAAQTLLSFAPDGSILYDMATGHEVSEDGKTYTFTLVDGATWHDGEPVTAADVAFTYNTALKEAAGSNIAGRLLSIVGAQEAFDDKTGATDASGIRVIDDHTIAFDLVEPNAQFLPTLVANTRIAPAHVYEGVPIEQYADQPASTTMFIGSGPYKMTEFTPKESVYLEPHDGYVNGSGYKGAPAAPGVSIRIYSDEESQILSTQSGEVDFNYVRKPSGDKLALLQSIDGMQALKSLVGFNIFASFNLKNPSNPLLLDKRVRQALVWALDRDVLVNDVLGGVFTVPEVMNHWIQEWAVADDLERYYPQNVDKAKALLAEAGWDPASAPLLARHYPPTLDPDVPIIQSMWSDVGVSLDLQPLPDDTFFQDFYGDKDPSTPEDDGPAYDVAFVYGFGTLDGSPWGSDEFLGSDRVNPAGLNSMRFANEEWDQEFAAALLETSREAQAPHFQRASEIFNDELPYIPLYQRVDYSVVSDGLKGPENATILHPAAGGVKYWEWYKESE